MTPRTIVIDSSAEIRVAPMPRGRPRESTYGQWPTRSRCGNRLRCRASGCRVRLRKNDGITCSDACAHAIRAECELLLQILDGELGPEELPPYMRTDRLRRKRTM